MTAPIPNEVKLRAKQREVVAYDGGWMGVSAVPGSGKTWTLSYLAARLVLDGRVADGQEVLVVTLVNAAVNHFAQQVGTFVQVRGLLPGFRYRVRTLHGLANDIVRERPALVGLEEGFQIIDERDADDMLRDAALGWVRSHAGLLERYVSPELDERDVEKVRRQGWEQAVVTIAKNFISQAKDLRMTAYEVQKRLDAVDLPLPLAEMGAQVYRDYERGLRYRGAVDFQDLIRLALQALESDPEYCARLRNRWPYVLEDEAQDSSALQEQILRLLVGPDGNWVRVGDPNQAIYESFTTASPEFLRAFLREKRVQRRELPNSGRSTRDLIKLANHLIDWSAKQHPVPSVRKLAPLQGPKIKATPRGDPQPNPKNNEGAIHIWPEPLTPDAEIAIVVKSIKRWLPQHPDRTAAVLVPRNDRGAKVAEALRQTGLDVVEMLRSAMSTRQTAGALKLTLEHLSTPTEVQSLARTFRVWRRDDRHEPERKHRLDRIVGLLRGLRYVETYLYPGPLGDWLADDTSVQAAIDEDTTVLDDLLRFRELVQRWQSAAALPIDQLILVVAQDLFSDALSLATAYSLAMTLRGDSDDHPDWQLFQFVEELRKIAQNQRRVLGLGEEDTGFDPDAHRGKVAVTTMHRAKGLEWDRVYLMSVNSYNFPSAEPGDSFIGEKYFVRDNLNLEAEALAQLRVLADESGKTVYTEGTATQAARLEYVSERLRLLYVGITRARRDLIVTWNTGRTGKSYPSVPVTALQAFMEKQR